MFIIITIKWETWSVLAWPAWTNGNSGRRNCTQTAQSRIGVESNKRPIMNALWMKWVEGAKRHTYNNCANCSNIFQTGFYTGTEITHFSKHVYPQTQFRSLIILVKENDFLQLIDTYWHNFSHFLQLNNVFLSDPFRLEMHVPITSMSQTRFSPNQTINQPRFDAQHAYDRYMSVVLRMNHSAFMVLILNVSIYSPTNYTKNQKCGDVTCTRALSVVRTPQQGFCVFPCFSSSKKEKDVRKRLDYTWSRRPLIKSVRPSSSDLKNR